MLFRWAFRELRRSWKSASFFILNLSLGLTGFISLEAYKTALQNHVAENRRQILGGDLAVSVRREMTPEELGVLSNIAGDRPLTIVYDFFAMASSKNGSRLALIKAVDSAYPMYGEILLDDRSKFVPANGGAWIDPEVATQMKVARGDRIQVGQLDLEVRGLITEDSTRTFRAGALAPRIFIDRSQLAASGLIQFGSTFTRAHLYKLANESEAPALQEKIYAQIKDPSFQVENSEEASQDSARQLRYLSDFLGLVALVGLFLAALGAAYLWRLFLQQRTKDVAILRSLGLSGNQAVLLYIIEATILGSIAIVPAVIGAQIVFPILNGILSQLTPFDLNPLLTPSSIALGFGLSLGTSLLVALPFLLRLREVRPAKLFSEEKFDPQLEIRRPWALLPAAALLWALAILQSNSLKVGSLFVASLAGVIVILLLVGWFGLKGLSGWKFGPWDLRHGLRSAVRRRAASLSIFLALGLGSLLMNILPQVKASLQKELTIEGTSQLPSLFMFDIQDEQLGPLQEILAKRDLKVSSLSPLIRSRLIKVNGTDYERSSQVTGFKTREEEREARFRNRGINLSYRSDLSDAEGIVEGRAITQRFDANSGKIAELSVEREYAKRMGLQLGDRLVFDVQGVELEGEIVNLRTVKWASFQPNFFILIQPGALDDAPKIWLASLPRLDEGVKVEIQNDLSKGLGNVSIIDVGKTITDVLKMAEQMSWSLEFMAVLSVITGAVVLYSIAHTQVRGRRWELNLLKVLGARPSHVRRYILAEFVLIAGMASMLGALLSILVSSVLIAQIFDAKFTVDLKWLFGTTFIITLLAWFVAGRASATVIREKPLTMLRGTD